MQPISKQHYCDTVIFSIRKIHIISRNFDKFLHKFLKFLFSIPYRNFEAFSLSITDVLTVIEAIILKFSTKKTHLRVLGKHPRQGNLPGKHPRVFLWNTFVVLLQQRSRHLRHGNETSAHFLLTVF